MKEDRFIIEVEVDLGEAPPYAAYQRETMVVKVDLSNPAYEEAVLAAAGRFTSLKRTRRGGGRPRKRVTCKHGRRLWVRGGKKCPKCEKEKNEEARGKDQDGTEANRNGSLRNRVGKSPSQSASEPGQEDQHADHPQENA